SLLSLDVGQESVAALRELKHQVCFREFTGSKERALLRNQPRGLVELSKSFFETLLILEFDTAKIIVTGFLEVLLRGNAVDGARHTVGAGGRRAGGWIVPCKRGNGRHCRDKTNHESG